MNRTATHGPLGPAQLEQFERHGFTTLGVIVDGDELDALLAAEERFRPRSSYGADGASAGLLVRDQLCHFSTPVRQFCTRGRHLDAVAQLLGPDVAFTHTQFITKLPGDDRGDDSAIPLHQDNGYGTLDPPLDVTVWTALTSTDEENGCLRVIPGSHAGGLVEHAVAAANPALREARGDGAVALPLAAGEAVVFSGMLLHGSGPNRSTRPRVGMHARYCHPAVRMVTEGGRPVLADMHSWMVRGEASMQDWRSANDKFLDRAAT